MRNPKLSAGIIIATVLWFVMFSPWTAPHVNFWVMMTISGLILTTYTTWARPGWWKDVKFDLTNIVLGTALAAVMWGVFWLGDFFSSLLFDFARPQVDSIYGMKTGGKSLGAHSPAAINNRPCRGNILERVCTEEPFGQMEPEYRFHRHDSHLQPGASAEIQFHAHHGCRRGRLHLGTRLPLLP